MSAHTDAYEVDPRDYRDLGYRMDNRAFNGSTKLITTLLALMNLLASAAIVGGVIMYGRLQALDTKVQALDGKVDLIIMGHIKIQNP